MQPNSMQPTAAPSVAPAAPTTAPKKNTGLIVGMVLCALLGVGGLSFGIFGLINAQQKTPEIADLDIKYTTKEGESVTIDTDKIEISEDKKTITIDESTIKKTNPILSNDSYSIGFTERYYTSDGQTNQLGVSVNNGTISSCTVSTVTPTYVESISTNAFTVKYLKDCTINGISGKISKVARIGEGQDGSGDSIAFVLEDGTVDYLPMDGSFESSAEETIKGKIKIDGFVTDIMTINVKQEMGGYVSTVFVLSDGTIVKYNKDTMLQ